MTVGGGWASSSQKFNVGLISFPLIIVWEMQHESIHTMTSISTNRILNAPELHISIFAFLLNFVWELLQMPLFAGFADFQHYQATLHCTKGRLLGTS